VIEYGGAHLANRTDGSACRTRGLMDPPVVPIGTAAMLKRPAVRPNYLRSLPGLVLCLTPSQDRQQSRRSDGPLVIRDTIGQTGVARHQPSDADPNKRKRDPVGLQRLADAAIVCSLTSLFTKI
jgi:hypothetical protein